MEDNLSISPQYLLADTVLDLSKTYNLDVRHKITLHHIKNIDNFFDKENMGFINKNINKSMVFLDSSFENSLRFPFIFNNFIEKIVLENQNIFNKIFKEKINFFIVTDFQTKNIILHPKLRFQTNGDIKLEENLKNMLIFEKKYLPSTILTFNPKNNCIGNLKEDGIHVLDHDDILDSIKYLINDIDE